MFGAYYRFGLTDDEILQRIALEKPDYIGITSNFTAYFNVVADLAEKIKQHFSDIKIIIGGYHATVYKEEVLNKYKCFDYVVKGADENEFLRIVGLPSDIEHCFTKTIPDRSFITSSQYQMHKKNFSFIVATRGCPRRCTFCTVASMHGNSFVLRSVESILEEMLYLYDKHEVRVFDFEDDNLSFNRNWYKELLEGIIKTFPLGDIQLYAMNGISVETLSKDLLNLMWLAGFRNLNFSLVTAQDDIKKKLNRPFSNEQFELIVKEANLIGYEITAYLIIGLPEQTKQDIDETISYLAELGVLIAPSFYYPPPGTKDFDFLVEKGWIDKDNWISFRSSVFPVETDNLKREDLVYFFRKIRLLNFIEQIKKKYNISEISFEDLEKISPKIINNIKDATEEEIGVVQVKEYLVTGKIELVFK